MNKNYLLLAVGIFSAVSFARNEVPFSLASKKSVSNTAEVCVDAKNEAEIAVLAEVKKLLPNNRRISGCRAVAGPAKVIAPDEAKYSVMVTCRNGEVFSYQITLKQEDEETSCRVKSLLRN